MKKFYRIIILAFFTITLIACGDSKPDITYITVKSDRGGIVLDTNDNAILSKIKPIFYEKKEAPDAGPDFKYLVDLKFGKQKERWQYSDKGFIRNFDEGFTMIYQLREVSEFNKIANIK